MLVILKVCLYQSVNSVLVGNRYDTSHSTCTLPDDGKNTGCRSCWGLDMVWKLFSKLYRIVVRMAPILGLQLNEMIGWIGFGLLVWHIIGQKVH